MPGLMPKYVSIRGNKPRVTVRFKDALGALVDPTTVTFMFKTPNSSTTAVTTYIYLTDAELVRDAQGVYHVDLDCSENGDWRCRFEASGAVGQAADDVIIHVNSPYDGVD